jgi:hypothetical protein
LNYILWLQDLLDSSSDEYGDDFDDERDVIGLDVLVENTFPNLLNGRSNIIIVAQVPVVSILC